MKPALIWHHAIVHTRWSTVEEIGLCSNSKVPKRFWQIGVMEHIACPFHEGAISAFDDSILWWCVWNRGVVHNSLFSELEYATNKFSPIVTLQTLDPSLSGGLDHIDIFLKCVQGIAFHTKTFHPFDSAVASHDHEHETESTNHNGFHGTHQISVDEIARGGHTQATFIMRKLSLLAGMAR